MSRTSPPSRESDEVYFQALGSFISSFALAESSLFGALKIYDGGPDEDARQKYGRQTVHPNVQALKTIVDAKQVPESPVIHTAV